MKKQSLASSAVNGATRPELAERSRTSSWSLEHVGFGTHVASSVVSELFDSQKTTKKRRSFAHKNKTKKKLKI